MNKKTVPLVVKRIIERIASDKPNLICPEDEEDSIVTFKEKNEEQSGFYFRLLKTTVDQDRTVYNIDFLPHSAAHLKPSGVVSCTEKGLHEHLIRWISLLEEYNQPSLIFDDLITKKYYEDLAPKFQIIDEDADAVPFNFEQQGLLLEIYEKTKGLVKDNENDENKEEAQAIIAEISNAEKKVSKEMKRESINRLRKVVAMCWKYSYSVAKAIMAEVIVEVGKRLLTSGL